MPQSRGEQRRRVPQVERLERLELLSTLGSAGVWTVTGTNRADTISVSRDPARPDWLIARVNGRIAGARLAAGVAEIQLRGLGGNDTLKIDESRGTIPIAATLQGGAGKNTLIGGSGRSTLDGGPTGTSLLQPGPGPTTLLRGVAADSARPFGSVASFRQFLARSASRFGSWSGRFRGVGEGGGAPVMSAPSTVGGHSSTNVQVAGVDEADIVETDGRYLYVISRDELVIVDGANPESPTIASRTVLDGSPVGEYLDGALLTVVTSLWQPSTPAPGSARLAAGTQIPGLWARGSSRVKVTTYDVSDASNPTVTRQTTLDGSYADSRFVDGKLDLVLQNDLFAGYWGFNPAALTGRGAGGSALTRLANAPLDRILPGFTSEVFGAGGSKVSRAGLINEAKDIYQPVVGDEVNLLSVVVIDTRGGSPGPLGASSLVGSYASTVHVTPDEIDVFTPRWDTQGNATTSVYRFDLPGARPVLSATGSVPGSLFDPYSADVHDGYLRVATTAWQSGGPDNGVYVLQKQGNRLNVVGSIDQLAPGESIYATRFLGDRLFQVTFEQVDPLWAIDLSNPTAPKVAGELKVPGFSRFLQVIDANTLLGIGREVDPITNRTSDLKLSLFNVADLSQPQLIASQAIAPSSTEWTWSDAEWTPHALGWFPELGAIAVPVQGSGPVLPIDDDGITLASDWTFESNLYVFHIDAALGAKAIQELGKVEHGSSVSRSVRIGDVIFSIADEDVKAVRLAGDTLTSLGSVTIQTATSGWHNGGGFVLDTRVRA
ncbi:MAG: beta-propeller domain-containing protein [Isosphaeraceae bacterium]